MPGWKKNIPICLQAEQERAVQNWYKPSLEVHLQAVIFLFWVCKILKLFFHRRSWEDTVNSCRDAGYSGFMCLSLCSDHPDVPK
ncbi:hypothetical protein XELAEV_18017529mg [Xenopus laevis]|uniref:Uncharacterized protein n=1 Tax=Xenopus laevis TaxID=8355 RepID=A0A974DBC1_XENLA|nr:hypothetical protein XELAEV_18017529mg [Xenopus laevis]